MPERRREKKDPKTSFRRQKFFENLKRNESTQKRPEKVNPKKIKKSGSTTVVVKGIPNCPEEELIKFLRHKKGNFAYREVIYDDRNAYILLTDSNEAYGLARIGSLTFNQTKIELALYSGEPGHIITKDKQEELSKFIKSRVNMETRVLDLSNIQKNSELKAKNIQIDINNSVFMAGLFRTIKYTYPEVFKIDFSSNQISELGPFKNMSFYLPRINSLLFHDNNIKEIRQLDFLREINLLETSFMGNPIQKNKEKKEYTTVVTQKLKNLQILDKEPVEKPKKIIELPPLSPNCLMVNEKLVSDFVLEYHTKFELERSQVVEAYSDTSILTFFSSETSERKEYKPFNFTMNRNLKSEKGAPIEKVENISFGKESITRFLSEFPRCSFVFQSFVFDALEANLPHPVLVITIHGFIEMEEKKAAFDRTFLLQQKKQGPGIEIVNDMFNIHPFDGKSIVP